MNWSDLADVRRRGLRPGLAVFVTDRPALIRNAEAIGCMGIFHRRGEPMPVELLHGLDVWFHFGKCELVGRIKRLMDAKGVEPASMRAWCACGRDFVVTCGQCDTGNEPWAA